MRKRDSDSRPNLAWTEERVEESSSVFLSDFVLVLHVVSCEAKERIQTHDPSDGVQGRCIHPVPPLAKEKRIQLITGGRVDVIVCQIS